jgi:hypothetical protein
VNGDVPLSKSTWAISLGQDLRARLGAVAREQGADATYLGRRIVREYVEQREARAASQSGKRTLRDRWPKPAPAISSATASAEGLLDIPESGRRTMAKAASRFDQVGRTPQVCARRPLTERGVIAAGPNPESRRG